MQPGTSDHTELARKLGLFDAAMIAMGGMVGSGIFINSYVVARQLPDSRAILAAWAFGGCIALAGGYLYAEIAARRPNLMGQYAYLRDAYHPLVGFLYGWGLLLVIQTGGMAAVAVTFAKYFLQLTGLNGGETLVAAAAVAVLTAINCGGVRAGGTTQNVFMILKICAIATLVVCGWTLRSDSPRIEPSAPVDWRRFGVAMTPVLFAYGGWQTTSFIAGELRNPKRDLSRGILYGVLGVVVLYLSVNAVYLAVLGPGALANTTTPASTTMRTVLGAAGARWTALAIAVSTFGFLSQAMLTAPRVYFTMAADGLFFKRVAQLNRRTQAPAAAIVLQGAWTMVIAVSGRYEQILNYVVCVDFLFIGLTATCVFVFRRRDANAPVSIQIPGHPFTTVLFVGACWSIVGSTIYEYPVNTFIGLAILLAGLPVYYFWKGRQRDDDVL